MKRTLLWVAVLVVAMMGAGCQKERHRGGGDDEGYGTATGKHIVQETAVSPEGKTLVTKYTWNNTQLQRLTIADSLDVSFSYNGSRLTSFTYRFGTGMTQTYTLGYADDRIVSASTTLNGLEQRYDFEYNAEGEISTMMQSMSIAAIGVVSTTSYSLTWQDGNLIEKRDQDGYYVRYQYDTHPTAYALDFPMAYFLASGMPEMTSENNFTMVESYNASGREVRYLYWTYTADGYPKSNGRDDVGFNYYLYADGEGSTGNGNGGGNGGGGTTPTDIMSSITGTQWVAYDQTVSQNEVITLHFTTSSEGTLSFVETNSGYSETLAFTYTYSAGNGKLYYEQEEPLPFIVTADKKLYAGELEFELVQ